LRFSTKINALTVLRPPSLDDQIPKQERVQRRKRKAERAQNGKENAEEPFSLRKPMLAMIHGLNPSPNMLCPEVHAAFMIPSSLPQNLIRKTQVFSSAIFDSRKLANRTPPLHLARPLARELGDDWERVSIGKCEGTDIREGMYYAAKQH
jgi:hypothetical protein